jgi:PKD repeat protein
MNQWVSYMDGLPNVIVNELEIHYPTNKILAGTYGRGLWESDLYTISNTPIANFSSNENNICVGNNIQFFNQSFNNGSVVQWLFEGGIPNTSTANNPIITYNSTGNFGVTLIVQNSEGIDTLSISDFVIVTEKPLESTPFEWNFEPSNLLPQGWEINNPDFFITWSKSNVGFNSNGSIFINNYEYDDAGQKDQFITNNFDIGSGGYYLAFDVAYSPFPGFADSLNVYYSNDCNQTLNRIYSKGGNILMTSNSAIGEYFIPTSSEWRREIIDLNMIAHLQNVSFTFENVSGFGNAMYIDNINVAKNLNINELSNEISGIKVYPNPFSEILILEQLPPDSKIRILSVKGSLLISENNSNNTNVVLNLSHIPPGIYFAEITTKEGVSRHKIVKVK